MAEEEEVASSPPHHIHKNIPVVDVAEKRRRPRFYYIPTSGSDHRPATGRILFSAFLLLLLLAGVTALVLYLVYRPSHPRFSVTAVSVYTLGNATAPSGAAPLLPPAVSASMQFTVVIRNPNDRASVHYDRLTAYASYRGQPITPPLQLPPLFQERDSAVTVSPVLGGASVPVSSDAAAGLAADAAYGVVPLRLVVLGRVRYKSGPYHGGWRGMAVQCNVLVGVRRGATGQVPLLGAPDCDVDA